MTTDRQGRFTETTMTAALRQIAERLKVPVADARLLRLTNNAVFALPSAGLVVRITRSYQLHERAAKVTQLGEWFAHLDAPTIRLAPSLEQPLEVDGLTATIWRYLPPAEPAPSVEDLGTVLRSFHRLGTPPFALPRWDPIGDARRRLADAEGLSKHDRDLVLHQCERLQPAIADLNNRAAGGLVHGDAHVGNLLRDSTGRVLLCDFDATCIR